VKLSPDRALLTWAFVWLVLSLLSVPILALRVSVPIAGVLLLAAVLADFFLALREPALQLTRIVPDKGARDRPEEITLRVVNPLPRAIVIDVQESIPRDLVLSEPDWSGLRFEAKASRDLTYTIKPMVRGRREWGRAVALVGSPLGLLRRRIEGRAGDSILVQPETRRYLRSEALDPKRVLTLMGVRPKRMRGDGLEFESLREYVVGDEPRRIDWRATARRGRPIVRNHRHEESRTILLALDRSRLMGARAPHDDADEAKHRGFSPTKLDHAIDAALALAFASLVAGDRVGLILFDRAVVQLVAPVIHRASLGRFVDALSAVQPVPFEADYRRVTRDILTLHRKRAMVVVLTDFMEVDRDELIRPMSLLARHHEVVFVALREPILEQLEEVGEVGDVAAAVADADPVEIYRRIVLSDLLREREGRLVTLRRQGISVLDVPPSEATASALNRYMELRYGAG
jgi:uncharacterized protein (DUF58 family)